MIIFRTVRWKNFLSTGNAFTEIDLCRSPNTLILGKNGAGKSTILDVLTFGLFGKPYRKINKPQLVNTINQNNCVVEILFTILNKEYKVVRGIKPNVFQIFCNNELVNQNSSSSDYQEVLEKNILKLNYKSFTQVVILGSASFVPFMQLSAADRRSIIEELLNINIFSSMNTIVKNRLSDIKDKQKDVEYTVNLTKEKIELQKQNIEESKKNSIIEIEKKEIEIANNESLIETHNSTIEETRKKIEELTESIEDKPTVESKNTKLVTYQSKMDDNIKKFKKEIVFFETNDTCPTCYQIIDQDVKGKHIHEKKEKITEVEGALTKLVDELEKVYDRLDTIQSTQKEINRKNSDIIKSNAEITAINKYIRRTQQEIDELKRKNTNIDNDDEKIKSLNEELANSVKAAEALAQEKHYHDFAATLLKDTGIKTKIIKQYLPIMNKLINKYLTSMDFFVNFNLNENFEETIKSRHRDEFSYASFSEGEKMRIDLALLFTWRQVAKIKNSTNTNLLILDEVFDSSLDTVGTEEFLKLLNEMDNNTNVFVISHKGDQLFDKFRSVIKFTKKNNFSVIER
jgi:DNA repair exonuclease SbcCD ATPase subunit